jgi:hypothetical protein
MAMQAQAQKEQAQFQADVQRRNMVIAQQNADAVVQQGQAEEERHRERVAQSVGTGKVALASRGLAIGGTGEAGKDALDDLLLAGAMDIFTLRHNVSLQKREAMLKKDQYQMQATLFDKQAASINPALAGITGLVGGIQQSGLLVKGKTPW